FCHHGEYNEATNGNHDRAAPTTSHWFNCSCCLFCLPQSLVAALSVILISDAVRSAEPACSPIVVSSIAQPEVSVESGGTEVAADGFPRHTPHDYRGQKLPK